MKAPRDKTASAGGWASRLLVLTRAGALVWSSARGAAAAQLALAVLQGVMPLAGLYAMKRVVDAATAGVASGGGAAAWADVGIWLAAGALVAIGLVAARSLAALVGEALQQSVLDSVYDRLHAKSLAVDLEFYEDPKAHDRMHLAQEQAASRPARLVSGLTQLAQNGIGLAGILILVAAFHWTLALALAAAALPALWFRVRDARRLYAWRKLQAPAERESNYFHWLLTGDTQAKELRVYGHGDYCRRRFQTVRALLRRERLALLRRVHTGEAAAGGLAALVMLGACLTLVGRLFAGALTLGGLVMYVQAFQRAQAQFAVLFGALAGLYEDSLFLGAFFELMDLPARVRAPAAPRPVPHPLREGVVFENVSFTYPGARPPALRDVSLTLRPGECVALAGANGAGKTTLVKLLCRLYDPDAGRILLDGLDLREFDPAELRRRIGILFQDFAHYQLSARDNIWVGSPELPADSPRIRAAAEASGAAAVIAGLSRGYDTLLGHWFQDGEEISLGQWQKLALARAFVRDADLVVLDEPSSALDPFAEAAVLNRWRQIAAGRVALIVSHHRAAVRLADRVVVLREGRVVEEGPPAALMARAGEYARLFQNAAPEDKQ